MSIKLANGEKIVRSYDYGMTKTKNGLNSNATTKNLTITNKRIIHRQCGKGLASDSIIQSDMPINSAKYVNVSYKRTRYPIFLIWALLMFVLSILCFAQCGEPAYEGTPIATMFTAFGIITMLAAIAFIFMYIFKKDYAIDCNISAEGVVTPNVFAVSSRSYNSRTSRVFSNAAAMGNSSNKRIKIRVNGEIAKQIAEELGAVITSVNNGEFDE